MASRQHGRVKRQGISSPLRFQVDALRFERTNALSSAARSGPQANMPGSSGDLLLQRTGRLSRVRTKPPELSTRAAPAATSHSFLGVSVKVASAKPAQTKASL